MWRQEGGVEAQAGCGDVPDRSRSDFYCQVCNSHMNSPQMWESHITGKRHSKNLKKPENEFPSKTKAVTVNKPAMLYDLLIGAPGPIVGLNYVCEMHKMDPKLDPSFTCYLCHASATPMNIVDHLVSAKHQLNFIKKVDEQTYNILQNMTMTKIIKDHIAKEKAEDWENRQGRGKVEVKQEIPKSAIMHPRRNYVAERGYVDLDAPGQSSHAFQMRSTLVSEASTSAASASSSSDSILASASENGIEELDIVRDMDMLDTDAIINALEMVIDKGQIKVEDDAEARIMLDGIMKLNQCILKHQLGAATNKELTNLLDSMRHPDPNWYFGSEMVAVMQKAIEIDDESFNKKTEVLMEAYGGKQVELLEIGKSRQKACPQS